MSVGEARQGRRISAVHGKAGITVSSFEAGLIASLREEYGPKGLLELYGRFAHGDGMVDALMRSAIIAASAGTCGPGLKVGSGAAFKHVDTFEIGEGVFIGAQANIQGRFDGTCRIGRGSWIGPQAFLDARDLVIGEHVGWGPGAKLLGSAHVAEPIDRPIIETDLHIGPVVIGDWADIGTNAVILPGVTIGKGAIVGAGAVVTSDVAPFSVVAGVPAKFLHWRSAEDKSPLASKERDHG
jgi:acetyltransferase-like isoleucine patch superfamily enzyme